MTMRSLPLVDSLAQGCCFPEITVTTSSSDRDLSPEYTNKENESCHKVQAVYSHVKRESGNVFSVDNLEPIKDENLHPSVQPSPDKKSPSPFLLEGVPFLTPYASLGEKETASQNQELVAKVEVLQRKVVELQSQIDQQAAQIHLLMKEFKQLQSLQAVGNGVP